MVDYYSASFASLHVRVSNRPALYMYKENLGFEILGIEKGYYADKEDAYKMKKFFKEAEREKEKHKIIQLTSDVKWEDIEDTFEEVDQNGEEVDVKDKEEKKEIEGSIQKEQLGPAAEDKKKKKKNKKKK